MPPNTFRFGDDDQDIGVQGLRLADSCSRVAAHADYLDAPLPAQNSLQPLVEEGIMRHDDKLFVGHVILPVFITN